MKQCNKPRMWDSLQDNWPSLVKKSISLKQKKLEDNSDEKRFKKHSNQTQSLIGY